MAKKTVKLSDEAAAKTVAEAAMSATGKTLSARQWAEVEAIWVAGVMTRAMLAEKFGVTERTITRHMTAKKIVRAEKADEHRAAVVQEIGKAQVDDATIMAARIRETKEDHYKMVSGLGKLTWAEVLKAKQDGSPISVAMNNLKALDAAISNIKKVREEKWAILGLDKADYIDEEGLPNLVISELTADQVDALRNRDHTEIDDLPQEVNQDSDGEEIVSE